VQTIASTHFGDFRCLQHSAKYQLLEAQSPPKEGFVSKLSRIFLDPARQRDSLVSEDISAHTRTFKLFTALLSNISNVFVSRKEKTLYWCQSERLGSSVSAVQLVWRGLG